MFFYYQRTLKERHKQLACLQFLVFSVHSMQFQFVPYARVENYLSALLKPLLKIWG